MMNNWNYRLSGLKLLALAALIFSACASENNRQIVPGVVIAHTPKEMGMYLGSPSICILPDGSYLVSHDCFGKTKKKRQTPIFRSGDRGKTWMQVSTIEGGQSWSNLFVYHNDVYIMGTRSAVSETIIRRSTDEGATWSEPDGAQTGLVAQGRFHTAPVPIVIQGGRIWRGIEILNDDAPRKWPKQYSAAILSAPEGSDLMDASNWELSNPIHFDSLWMGGRFGGWLEGNVVPTPEGGIKLVMRVELPDSCQGEYVALIDVDADNKEISFDPATGFVPMPGGAKKFTIRYDPLTRLYLTLSNEVLPQYREMNPGTVRNTLSLCSSKDLLHWVVNERILEHDDVEYHGFQYVDWQFEGEDIIFVSRTAHEDGVGGANSHHDSNYITFHRIEKFRRHL